MESYSIVIGIIFIIIFYIIKHPRQGIDEPPLVPYTIPILGHTYDYLFNAEKFIAKCKEQYGDCFSIYVFGSLMTIVSNNCSLEVFKSHEDFDITSAISDSIPFHLIFPYNGGLNRESIQFQAKTTRDISKHLESNIPVIENYLLKGIDKWIGDCKDPKTIDAVWSMMNNVVTLPIANVLVGKKAASHEDLVKSFADVTFDLGPIFAIPPIFSFIHKKLHQFIISLPVRFGWNPVSHHRKIVMNRLKPIIEERLEEQTVLGSDFKPYHDVIEFYMNQPNFDLTKPDNLPYHIDNLFVLLIGAIVTTSRPATSALYDLAGRPECQNELYEEALAIDKECNGSLTMSDIRNMKKLDSLLKESLRLTDSILSFPHYVISKSYTFANGYTIPKGRLININLNGLLKSKESFGDDADEFKPFRFVAMNSPATKVDHSYTVFGCGRHACPGRFLAVNEIKMILHKIILKYNISTKSGKIEDKLFLGPIALPPRGALVFENRK